ncbi:alpha/beta hydrolase family protein [Taklimakanibacter lacteus]|uniref:alpha/beta hydrolase family protein n=1 Tax=Taklimakanibacter lacteus TaxID=2268456 RepID=UPI000E66A5AC
MLKFAATLLTTVLSATAVLAGDQIGFKEITVADASRPLHVALWYPTDAAGPLVNVAENGVFYGVAAIKDAVPQQDAHPLIVLSHGYGGSWRNLSWLAGALAQKGYVVAVPDHPGTTFRDRDPAKAARLWERPRDLSRSIDALIADPQLAGGIARDRIAAIGHSLGGWTAAEIAGARFDADLIMPDCDKRFGAVACKVFAELGLGQSAGATETLRGDLSDQRIGAAVTLDLGPARGFTLESLARMRVPFLVIAAGADVDKATATQGQIAATNEDSRYIAQHLPKATSPYEEIADSLHFSFMQICKPGAVEIIREEAPGEEFVCRDGGTRGRQAIHEETVRMITAFLGKSLPEK